MIWGDVGCTKEGVNGICQMSSCRVVVRSLARSSSRESNEKVYSFMQQPAFV